MSVRHRPPPPETHPANQQRKAPPVTLNFEEIKCTFGSATTNPLVNRTTNPKATSFVSINAVYNGDQNVLATGY